MLRRTGTIVSIMIALLSHAQEGFLISGRVVDERNGEGLSFATVYVEELESGVATDLSGNFKLPPLPENRYHVVISHVGCESVERLIDLKGDTILVIKLHHHQELLGEILVEGSREGEVLGESRTSIRQEEIIGRAGDDLARMVVQAPGVRLISSGGTISKPMIQGLTNNRVDIIDDGVVLSGQQWGADHAPESSPLKADRILVIRGVDGIAYGGSGLGGIIKLDNGRVTDDPHLHGRAAYIYGFNGRSHRGLAQLQQAPGDFRWRVAGTWARGGDMYTPDYFLRNMGFSEGEADVQLDHQSDPEGWYSSLSYSYYQTSKGILRGAHIGNLTDLGFAISRDEPFFTEDDFTYAIEVPRQEVFHHTIRASTERNFDFGKLEFLYAFQFDNREEFDVRRGNREDRPVLSLNLWDQQASVQLRRGRDEHHEWRAGIRFNAKDNENDPETGTVPLIPDYEEWRIGPYFTLERERERFGWSVGARGEYQHMDILYISEDRPLRFLRDDLQFLRWAFSSGIHMERRRWTLDFGLGLNQRPPAINELYSFGLHQGVAAIEEGDTELNPERSLKAVSDLSVRLTDRLVLELSSFAQYVDGYIYLRALPEPRLTIRGAFPVFRYTQTDGTLYGNDARLTYVTDRFGRWTLRHDFTRGLDRQTDDFLVLMPQDRTGILWNWQTKEKEEQATWSVQLEYSWQWEQTRTDLDAEFAPPPPAYGLLGGEVAVEPSGRWEDWRLGITVNNALNTSYRDYLDRLRYFADAPGWDVRVNLSVSF